MKFEVGDTVKVVATKKRMKEIGLSFYLCLCGETGKIIRINNILPLPYYLSFRYGKSGWFGEKDLILYREDKFPSIITKKHEKQIRNFDKMDEIRQFPSGSTRDTAQGKLDYVKALSPVVLRRYVQYLDKHRLQPGGNYRDFDNWKKGIPQEIYHSSNGRHFMDAWLLTDGYTTEDNHGPVELEDALCGQLFNIMGRLHEILKTKMKYIDRTKPVPGGY
jgi:hypothetical protein